jgi:hypothetical protein
MSPGSALAPTYLTFVVGFVVVATVFAVLSIVWKRLWMGLFALCARAALRVGLVSPGSKSQKTGSGKRDPGYLAFTWLLESCSRLIPGDASRHPHTFLLPIALIGIPMFVLGIALFWGVPLILFNRILQLGSGIWITIVAFLSMFAYVGVAGYALKLLARIPGKLRRHQTT